MVILPRLLEEEGESVEDVVKISMVIQFPLLIPL